MPPNILTFTQALAAASEKKHLLLGNGFSIALKPDIFSYTSLYENADFGKIPYAKELFETLSTRDFEAVIRVLISAAKILQLYPLAPKEVGDQIIKDANTIKTILVSAIAKNHPARPFEISDEQYIACRFFLSNFSHIYTLNYDVLLYWALMHDDVDELQLRPDDGFRHPEEDYEAPYVSWQEAHSPTIHYLHGALHLFDAGSEIIKYTWSKTDIPIIDQIREALHQEQYPIFVSEGESKQKLRKILHNAYLHKAFRSFNSICGQRKSSLFIFGHSLDANDDHVLFRVAHEAIGQLFISIFDDPNKPENKQKIARAQLLVDARNARKGPPLALHFFDASSAQVWG